MNARKRVCGPPPPPASNAIRRDNADVHHVQSSATRDDVAPHCTPRRPSPDLLAGPASRLVSVALVVGAAHAMGPRLRGCLFATLCLLPALVSAYQLDGLVRDTQHPRDVTLFFLSLRELTVSGVAFLLLCNAGHQQPACWHAAHTAKRVRAAGQATTVPRRQEPYSRKRFSGRAEAHACP